MPRTCKGCRGPAVGTSYGCDSSDAGCGNPRHDWLAGPLRPGLLAVAGLAGLGLAFTQFRMLQADLLALRVLATAPHESLEASSTFG